MSIPVEAATVMFAPQPVRSSRTILEPEPRPRRRSSLNKNVYFEIFKRNSGTPSIFDEFLQGWSSPTSKNDTGSPVEIVSFQRPQNPAPEHQSTIEEEQDRMRKKRAPYRMNRLERQERRRVHRCHLIDVHRL